MELSKNLIALCKKKGMTIAALAKESGIKQPTLHGWTTGRSVQNLDDLKKVCVVLEVGLHTLLYGEPDPFESNNQTPKKDLFKGKISVTIHSMEEE